MSRLEDRKAKAVEFIESIAKGGFREGLMSPDFWAWTGFSGNVERTEYLRRVGIVGKVFKGGLKLTIDRVTGEDDRVAVQARGKGTLFNGAPYTQSYHFLVEFDDQDRVRHCREYIDTHIVHEVLGPAMKQWASENAAA